jgi:hypothetical protein
VDHAFLINVHKDAAQAVRLCRVLRGHFGDGSGVIVYLDGPEYVHEQLDDLHQLATVIRGPHQPDKCLGVTTALSCLVMRAGQLGADTCSLLHPDMVPTDRAVWGAFLKRFRASGKALTWAPMHPQHMAASYISLHFRLPDAARLFPVRCERVEEWPGGGWFNEMQTRLSWDRAWPEWQQSAYEMTLHTVPYTGHHWAVEGAPCFKVAHGPSLSYGYHDYVPESSVVHTDDDVFWQNIDKIVRH